MNAYVVPSNIPKGAPTGPAAMRLVSRATQDEAHDDINDWLGSGLQSYTEEGQRMCDAANGVRVPNRAIPLPTATGMISRRQELEHSSPPPAYPGDTSVLLNEDNANTPLRSHESMQSGGIVRHITISGDYNSIHLNTGTGQQNIAHYDYRNYRDQQTVQGYDDAGNGGGDEGYNSNNETREDDRYDDGHRGRDGDRYLERERSRGRRHDDRYDDGYDSRDGPRRTDHDDDGYDSYGRSPSYESYYSWGGDGEGSVW